MHLSTAMFPFITPFRLRVMTIATNDRERPKATAEMAEPIQPFARISGDRKSRAKISHQDEHGLSSYPITQCPPVKHRQQLGHRKHALDLASRFSLLPLPSIPDWAKLTTPAAYPTFSGSSVAPTSTSIWLMNGKMTWKHIGSVIRMRQMMNSWTLGSGVTGRSLPLGSSPTKGVVSVASTGTVSVSTAADMAAEW